MKTRVVTFSNRMTLTIDQEQAKYIVRAFELLALTEFDTALRLLSLETGMTETALAGVVEIADMMRPNPTEVEETVTFGPWIEKSEYFPLA